MKALSFLVHTQQPILATSLQGDPNSDVSFSYIPGSMIRGVLIGRYLKQYSCQESNILENPDIKRLFFDGTIRFLNAYLFDLEKERRTLPVPLCLYKEKNQELEKIYNCSHPDIKDKLKSPQRINNRFCIIECNSVSLFNEKRRINIHNQRHRQRGKGIEGNGAIFRYDAIEAGQVFQGIVLCDLEDDAAIIKSLLTLPNPEQKINLWLGGSQSAGYGHVTVEVLNEENEETQWNEVSIDIDLETRIEGQENLLVTLLSDVILRDEYGQTSSNTQLFVNTISQLLKVELTHINTYANNLIVGGFNRKWGLPLPQVSAFSSGSVFVFKKPQFEDELKRNKFFKKLQYIENIGIGERKVDGFGRVTFNWLQVHDSFDYNEKKSNSSNLNKTTVITKESQEIATKMAERLFRQKLDDLILDQVNSNTPQDKKDRSSITNNQLSRLITVTTQALFNRNPDDLYNLIGRDKNSSNLTKKARDQFEKTKIYEISLDEKIRCLLRDYKLDGEQATDYKNWILHAWGTKNSSLVNNERLPTISIAGQSVSFDNDLSLEYTLRLIIAIAKKIMKDKNKDKK